MPGFSALRRTIIYLVPTLVLLPASASTAQSTQATAIVEDSRLLPYVHPGLMVDIGGRRINLLCSGTGRPTVVLMAGIGSWSPVWYKTQPVIARTTRVCSFDRASYGFSDPAPRPEIVSNVVDDLHAALKAGSIPGPYVLVGHSLGGIEARLYTQRWSSEVAGMVLVDTSPADEGLLDENQPGFDDAEDREGYTSRKLHCALLAAHGPIEPSSPDYKQCSLPLPSDTPDALKKVWPAFFTADHEAALLSLMSSIYTHRYDSVDHRSLGTMPLVVLSAENSWDDGTPASAALSRAYQKVWYAMHDDLSRLSSHGVHRIIKGSGHEIQLDKPEAVVNAVEDVLRQVQADKAMPEQ